MPEVATSFACEGCGKRYRWSSAVAGKKLLCTCGHPILVPADSPQEAIAGYVRTSRGLDTAHDESEEPVAFNLAGPFWRQFLIPLVFFIVGFAATIEWAVTDISVPHGEVLFWFLMMVSVSLMAAVFLAYGIFRSGKLGISQISFASATLKLVAILFLADAAMLWFYYLLRSTGAMVARMTVVDWVALLLLFIGGLVLVIFLTSYCLFYSQEDDFVAMRTPLAAGAWGLHFVTMIVLFAVLVLCGLHLRIKPQLANQSITSTLPAKIMPGR